MRPLPVLPVLLFAALASCGREPAASAPPASPPPADPMALEKSVAEISAEVARLRGLRFEHPVPAGIRTPGQFLAYFRRVVGEEFPPEKLAFYQDAYELFGFLEPGTDLLSAFEALLKASVGGFYDYRWDKAFYTITTFQTGAFGKVVMAHELCHALEDQHFDLGALAESVRGKSDRAFAFSAVMEGSATLVMNAWLAGMTAGGPGSLPASAGRDLTQGMETERRAFLAAARRAPPFLVATLNLPYLLGPPFLAGNPPGSSGPADPGALEHAFRDPPRSSEQILHREKFWDPARRDDPVWVDLPDLSPALGAGWSLAGNDVLGELGLFFLLALPIPDATAPGAAQASWTSPGAAGWGGDRFQLYRGPGGARVLLLAVVWDRAADRAEFLHEFRAKKPGQRIGFREAFPSTRDPRFLLVILADGKGVQDAPRIRSALLENDSRWQ
ncbi:MAG: hypothetical protein ACE5H3_10225 [Planctomycetota bacterium]